MASDRLSSAFRISRTLDKRPISNAAMTLIPPHSLNPTHPEPIESWDLSRVMAAIRAFSGEMQIEGLLSQLLNVMLACSRASKGALLLPQGENWILGAMGEGAMGEMERIAVLPSLHLQESWELPLQAIQWVAETRETLTLENAPESSNLTADPYIQTHQPQSLLCFPLLHREHFGGIAYLEHRQTAGLFSGKPLELLDLLASQGAIALHQMIFCDRLSREKSLLEDRLQETRAALEEAREQLIAREKLATLGLLTAGIAHEIRNPLNFVTNYAETSGELATEVLEKWDKHRDRFSEEDFAYYQELLNDLKNNASIIYQQGQRVESIMRSMMQHAASDRSQHQPTNINELLEQAAQLAYHSRRASKHAIHLNIQTEFDDSIGLVDVVMGDISRAFINLIDNACYAIEAKYKQNPDLEDSPTLFLKTEKQDEAIVIRIWDNGLGIAPDIQKKLFTPFFTTKPLGEGTGLGLFLTRKIIIEQHKGSLDLESELGKYTEFVITLPT